MSNLELSPDFNEISFENVQYFIVLFYEKN